MHKIAQSDAKTPLVMKMNPIFMLGLSAPIVAVAGVTLWEGLQQGMSVGALITIVVFVSLFALGDILVLRSKLVLDGVVLTAYSLFGQRSVDLSQLKSVTYAGDPRGGSFVILADNFGGRLPVGQTGYHAALNTLRPVIKQYASSPSVVCNDRARTWLEQ